MELPSLPESAEGPGLLLNLSGLYSSPERALEGTTGVASEDAYHTVQPEP